MYYITSVYEILRKLTSNNSVLLFAVSRGDNYFYYQVDRPLVCLGHIIVDGRDGFSNQRNATNDSCGNYERLEEEIAVYASCLIKK